MQTKIFAVQEASQVGELRRQGVRLAEKLGFDDHALGKVALVLTELATNILAYTHQEGGHILLLPRRLGPATGLAVLSLDRGPGIAVLGQKISVTAGQGLGLGLGVVRRLSLVFDLYTQPGRGTAVLAVLTSSRGSKSEHWCVREGRCPSGTKGHLKDKFSWGGICFSRDGSSSGGDLWLVQEAGKVLWGLLLDGLGHGPQAARAAETGRRSFQEALEYEKSGDPVSVLQVMERALEGTRGAVVAVVRAEKGRIVYAGLGNIAARLQGPEFYSELVSSIGVAGKKAEKSLFQVVKTYSGPSVLIMHSDGMKKDWRMHTYPGLAFHHPVLVAGVLYRDCARHRFWPGLGLEDDLAVLVVKLPSTGDMTS